MHFKLKENVKFGIALAAATRTADANGVSVDRKSYEGPVTFMVNLGASGDILSGTVYIELELEHSDDNSAWSDCANADLESTVTGTNAGTFAKIDDPAEDEVISVGRYIGSKRYVRLVVNVTGTHTNGTPMSATYALEEPRHAPVS